MVATLILAALELSGRPSQLQFKTRNPGEMGSAGQEDLGFAGVGGEALREAFQQCSQEARDDLQKLQVVEVWLRKPHVHMPPAVGSTAHPLTAGGWVACCAWGVVVHRICALPYSPWTFSIRLTLHNNSALLQLAVGEYLLREDVPEVLQRALGRQLSGKETAALLKCFLLDIGATMSWAEFERSWGALQALTCRTGAAAGALGSTRLRGRPATVAAVASAARQKAVVSAEVRQRMGWA